jgi:hypothetical protein
MHVQIALQRALGQGNGRRQLVYRCQTPPIHQLHADVTNQKQGIAKMMVQSFPGTQLASRPRPRSLPRTHPPRACRAAAVVGGVGGCLQGIPQ